MTASKDERAGFWGVTNSIIKLSERAQVSSEIIVGVRRYDTDDKAMLCVDVSAHLGAIPIEFDLDNAKDRDQAYNRILGDWMLSRID